jgi:hypothetical protein
VNILRVELLGEGGKPRDIDEEDTDLLTLAFESAL